MEIYNKINKIDTNVVSGTCSLAAVLAKLEGIKEIENKKFSVILHTFDAIYFYNNIQDIKINITVKNLYQLRVFNENEEYYYWRVGELFYYRHREDKKSNDSNSKDAKINYTDNDMLLRGVIANQYFDETNETTEIKKTLYITTRNYINTSGKAGYIDSRFVEIKNK